MAHSSTKGSSPAYAEYPEHRVDVEVYSGRVRVVAHGETVADSVGTLLVRESKHGPVYYFPRDDVRMEFLEATEHHTHCPFKGDASYWTLKAGGNTDENAVWSYEEPFDEVAELAGRLAFYQEKVDIRVDEAGA